MSINRMLKLCIISLVLVSGANYTYAILENNQLPERQIIPRPFNDELIPNSQREGQWIDHLGHLVKLNTLFAPQDIELAKTKFSIYNQHKSTEDITYTPSKFCSPTGACYGPYQYDIIRMSASGFNPNSRTVVMISGFLSDDRVDWMERTKESWLELDPETNVILVSWKDSNRYIYSKAAAITPLIARQITIFLYYLAELNGVSLMDDRFTSKIHFIGHSLGAHIGAFVGQDLAGKMGRITGLDPAGPFFDTAERRYRLDRTDAKLVVAIHTNGGKLSYMNLMAGGATQMLGFVVDKVPILNRVVSNVVKGEYTGEGDTAWFGINQQVGHIDYYANNGRVQPGCADLIHTCDHARSNEIYEDILKHELALKRESYDLIDEGEVDAWRKRNRLLAFNSDDYQSFSIGENLKKTCPILLGPIIPNKSVESTSTKKHQNEIKQCAVPIDLLTPVDVLIKELEEEYSVDLNSNQQSKNKYFFKTLSDRPLVGDHYLLKIRLGPSTSWHSSCAFHAELRMDYGVGEIIELNKELPLVRVEETTSSSQSFLVMPFINPLGAGARAALINLRAGGKTTDQFKAALDRLLRMIPVEVSLNISGSKSTGVRETVANRLLRFGFSGSASEKCQMDVVSIEIMPMKSFDTQFVGLYGWQSGNQAKKDLVQVLTFDQHKTLAPQRYVSKRSGRMLTKAQSSLSLRLDGVVLG